MTASRWRPGGWGPLIACIFWLAATAWIRPLALPDEGRYGGVAWEMLRSGQWLTPTLDGLPYFHKPPLFYWITAASMSLFGVHEWATRLAPMLGAILAAASLFMFARRWTGDAAARWSLIVFATAPLSYFGAQYANLDMLVAGCITATIFAGAHAVLSPDVAERRRAAMAAWALSALGVLAKGLIGAVLPAMVLVAWVLVARRWRSFIVLFSWRGALLFLVIAGPWFIAMQERFPDFFHYFFIVQHFQRFAEGGFNNVQPAWFYPAVLALLLLPWTPWLVWLAWRDTRGRGEVVPIKSLVACWAVLITLFFSLPQSKLVGYIFPVAAPLALLLGTLAQRLALVSTKGRAGLRATAVLAAVVCLVAVAGITWKADVRQRDLALALRGKVQPADEVVFLEEYYFAIGFYAQLPRPVKVTGDWSPEAVGTRDNWRKELADANRFDDSARVLVSPATMEEDLCSMPTVWLVGGAGAVQRHPWLATARVAARAGELTLWRVSSDVDDPVRAIRCGGKPIANSANKS